MAYVQEHLSPPIMPTSHVPESKDGAPVKPESWLELLCHDQVCAIRTQLQLAEVQLDAVYSSCAHSMFRYSHHP